MWPPHPPLVYAPDYLVLSRNKLNKYLTVYLYVILMFTMLSLKNDILATSKNEYFQVFQGN